MKKFIRNWYIDIAYKLYKMLHWNAAKTARSSTRSDSIKQYQFHDLHCFGKNKNLCAWTKFSEKKVQSLEISISASENKLSTVFFSRWFSNPELAIVSLNLFVAKYVSSVHGTLLTHRRILRQARQHFLVREAYFDGFPETCSWLDFLAPPLRNMLLSIFSPSLETYRTKFTINLEIEILFLP